MYLISIPSTARHVPAGCLFSSGMLTCVRIELVNSSSAERGDITHTYLDGTLPSRPWRKSNSDAFSLAVVDWLCVRCKCTRSRQTFIDSIFTNETRALRTTTLDVASRKIWKVKEQERRIRHKFYRFRSKGTLYYLNHINIIFVLSNFRLCIEILRR